MPRGEKDKSKQKATSILVALWTVSALFSLPESVRSQEVTYSVVPTYEEVRWDDAFGLERARLFGARVSLDFGPFFSLQPFYACKDEVEIRDGLIAPVDVSELFDVKAFGADMQVNMGRGSLVPFVRGGGGVLRTDDVEAGRRDRIFLRAGGGVRIGFGGSAGLEVSAERWATRLSAPLIPGAVPIEDFPEDGIVNSTVFGAGLRLPFGGSSAASGVSGILPGIFVEPYVARIDFHDELRLERQHLAGARAGVDLNQNVGLRGYYWRGTDDEFSDWMEISGYGGEAQFLLNSGSGLSPFLVAGAGRIEFKDDFRDLDGLSRTRENHLILGGGAAFGLGDRARIELGARNFLMTEGPDLGDITSPDELVSNWQYSAGVSLTLGARGRTAAERAAELDAEEYRDEVARLAEENRRLRAGEDPAQVAAVAGVDTVTTITIPVPAVGEIILRYGEAYAGRDGVVQGDTTQARLQGELIEAQLREIIREELAQAGIQPGAAPPVAVVVTPAEEDQPLLQDGRIHALVPLVGVQVSSPTQFVLGMRLDLGPISGPIPLTFLPELSLGIGDGKTTVRAAVNGRMGWNLDMGRNLTPYGQIGASITNQRFLSLDLAYGVTFDALQSSSRGPFNLFLEHRGVAFFDDNQILVGVSIPR